MSCFKDPKNCLCSSQQVNCDSVLISSAVGTVVGLCALILAVVVCSSKVSSRDTTEYQEDEHPTSNYPGYGKYGTNKTPLKTGSGRSNAPKAQSSDKQQPPSSNDRPGQYYDRVLGKWVDDVKMDEDGPLIKVIEPDPDGIPNLPFCDSDMNSAQPPQQQSWQSGQKIMIPPHYATRRGFGPWAAYYAPPPPPYGYNYPAYPPPPGYQQSNSYMAAGGYPYPQYHPSGSHHWPSYYVQGSSANGPQGWGPPWAARPPTGQPGPPTPSPVPPSPN